MTHHEMLRRLGAGDSIAAICAAAGLTRAEFDAWWSGECRRRVPPASGGRFTASVNGPIGAVSIERGRWGIPHVHAANDVNLFFGFGYATAQDRLFQLDFLRRKARGRLAEILGADGVESDVLHRTLGLAQIADREWTFLPADTQRLLRAYTAGINALIEDVSTCLPIQFDLLGYRPELCLPTVSLAVVGGFRWYLTVRFAVIVIPVL